ncbi:ferritin [Prevotella sp. DNF00663]|uniref:ferritin n=1 Tax=unclassified Prevotella TaxID=2638335 RepID=UPI000512F701|nr:MULTISPECIES: ferritin [unclassified Prevotella]KGI60786.1 ferritin [Prevotella sp. S7 MS 2]KXB82577.1 ferritin [Prevotella sp. DNF00663]
MISETLQEALNGQIVNEIYSANLYLSMSFYMEKEGFEGFSTWMKKQSAEEMDHAYQMANYIIKRGGTATVNQIAAVRQTWNSPLEAFEDAYKHECHVSKFIDNLLDKAIAEGDKATQDFLWQFVREQVEEEATASGIVDRIKKMGESAIFGLDQQYGARV